MTSMNLKPFRSMASLNDFVNRRVRGGEDVFAAARSRDPIAREVIETAGECVGATIGLLVNVLDPHAVVTGGGIGSAESLYWQSLEGWADLIVAWAKEIAFSEPIFITDIKDCQNA